MKVAINDEHMEHKVSPAAPAFPECLAWIERGSSLIRRMNSERIAEDPRLKRLLLNIPPPLPPSDASSQMDTIQEANVGSGEYEEKAPPPPSLALTSEQSDSFEELEAATDDNDSKQESENLASNAYRVLLWTYRVHATLQSSLQYALFAKTSEDGYFIPMAPRVYCIAPGYNNMFTRLFGAYSSARNWNAAVKLLEQLDTVISKRFENGACVFDCGLFDGIKRMHHKSLVFDEFCDGRVASISYCRGPTPSMHSAFLIASTVAAWLDLNPANVAILMAPNNEQMGVFATCCALYCTDAMSFPENFGNELLEVYQQHIRGSESWPLKLQRTLSNFDPKIWSYSGSVTRPQARFVEDFCKLLELRDAKLMECADSPIVEERKQKLTGVAVTPAPQSIYIQEIVLLSDTENANSADGVSPDVPPLKADGYRPYFVMQSGNGVMFSSLVNGVRNVDLSNGSHVFRVGKQFDNCGDFVLKMYHLPFGKQGQLLFESRLHSSILLELACANPNSGSPTETALERGQVGEITLSLANDDFDTISADHTLPKQFAVRIRYSRDASAFPPDVSSLSLGGFSGTSHNHVDDDSSDAHTANATRTSTAEASSFDIAIPLRARNEQRKAVRYDGPQTVSFLLNEHNVRTAFGDVVLEKVDVIRRLHRRQLNIFLLFHVIFGDGEFKVVPYRHLFRYVLPGPIRETMISMGATEESLNESAPSSFDVGSGMPFDEEYARWLQHIYDTDLDVPGSLDDEFLRGLNLIDVQPSADYRVVSLQIEIGQELSPPPSRSHRARGATSALIHQLPTYIYSTPKDPGAKANPDCLVCRCSFSVGEEIKSLPCFHSYHSDCIDSWLCLNKVCPVCQFSIDQAS